MEVQESNVFVRQECVQEKKIAVMGRNVSHLCVASSVIRTTNALTMKSAQVAFVVLFAKLMTCVQEALFVI